MSDDDEYTDADIAGEIAKVERQLTVEEIFEAGYNLGHANAGIASFYDRAWRGWLAGRLAAAYYGRNR